MSTDRTHVMAFPPWLMGIRIAQLVLAIIILGLGAFCLSVLAYSGASLSVFIALCTIVITIYVLVANLRAPRLYNYWALLALDIFCLLFWLIAFGVAAANASVASSYYYRSYYTYYKKRDLHGLTKRVTYTELSNSLAGVAGLGGLEFILFIITLVMTAIHVSRHRKTGGHCAPGSVGAGAAVGAPVVGAHTGGEKYEMQPNVNGTQLHPQQQYDQGQPQYDQTQQTYQQPQQTYQPAYQQPQQNVYASPQQGVPAGTPYTPVHSPPPQVAHSAVPNSGTYQSV